MANWIEITPGWETNETRQGDRRVRIFHDQSSTTGGLPAYGSVHPDNSNIFAFNITTTKLGDHPDHNLSKITYTPTDGEQEDPNATFGDLNRSMRIGGEMLTIDADSYFWASDGVTVNQKVFKRIITGTYGVQEIVSSIEPTNADGPLAKVIINAGQINSGTFQGQSSGSWLYMGADMEEFRNSSGAARWRLNHMFNFRRIPDSAIAGNVTVSSSAWGWRKVWREDSVKWDAPNESVSGLGGYLYDFTTFSDIFSTSGVA